MGSVLLEVPPPGRAAQRPRPTEPPLTFLEIRAGYGPGWSLAGSAIVHGLAVLLIAALSFVPVVIRRPSQIAEQQKLDILHSNDVLYLPTLGGGSEGTGHAGGSAGAGGKASSGLRARSRRGFAYPGPQPMISNPPRATLGIQTILQPSLPKLPLSHHYLPLPNIVWPEQVAAAAPPPPALVVKSERPAIRPPEKSVDAPKITLPAATKSAISDLAAVPQKSIVKPNLARPEVSDVQVGSRDQKGLLVLNAIPAAPDANAKIPLSESRSLFAISPGEGTVIADPSAGAKTGGSASSAGSGTNSDVASGDALADAASGGNGQGHGSGGSGNGTGHAGNGTGNGLNTADAGSGTGRGSASGTGVGSGAGTSAGSGVGAGSAPGVGGFPGITIKGGRYGGSASDGLHATVTTHHSYEMTIVSTASSGGGLPDFGVFSNEKVYTVYLNMSSGPDDPAPSWTLQFAVQHSPTDVISSGQVKPPYVLLKEIPQLPADLAQKCARKLIVASAVMNTNGKLEQVAVKQSPDNQLIAPLIEALSAWMFKPAEVDGQPVSLKVLLGIRLLPGR